MDNTEQFHTFVIHAIFFTIFNSIGLGLTQLIHVDYPQFYERDPQLSYYKLGQDQIPVLDLYVINFTILFVVVLICSIRANSNDNKYCSNFDLKTFTVSSLFAINCPILANTIAEILKRTASKARPRAFFDCCYAGFCNAVKSGDFTYYDQNTQANVLGDISKCENSNADIEDAFMSWPSGHATTSFVCMTACVLLLIYKFKWIECRLSLDKFIPYCMLAIAGWIAITRVQDYKHSQSDIFCGATIGTIVALLLWSLTQQMLFELNNDIDNTFRLTNGVRQGV